MVSQSAPAVIARNMPLPVVEADGEPPFVCATTYPNGPTGIATEGRVSPKQRWFEPRARVTVKIKDASQPVGIVGHYRELVLEFAGSIEGVKHVWAQDLLADRAEDIRSLVSIEGDTLKIPGEVIDRIGTAAGDPGDISAPGMVLRLEGSSLPVAGADYTPRVAIARPPVATKPVSLSNTATTEKDPYGCRVRPVGVNEGIAIALEKLPESIDSGSV